jgi:EmrB/QacA subfamily drug resistance transporter
MTSTPAISGRRLAALAVLCAAALMTVLDETVVNVAVPSIQRDLGFSTHQLSWVVNAYLVTYGSLLLLAGRVGDLLGRRRVLLAGLAVFTTASLGCGLAPTTGALIAARFVQGVGAALASSVALGMVVALFDEPGTRARAIGIYSFMASAGASTGLVLGGIITDVAGWRWAFIVNVPIGVVMLALGLRVLPSESAPGLRGGADYSGGLLLVAGLACALLAIVDPGRRPMAAPAVILLAAFVIRQIRARNPLVPVRVLSARPVVGANLVLAALGGAMLGFQYLATLYLQNVLGYSPAQSGLAIVPIAIGIAVLALGVYPRLSVRTGPRALIVPGMLAVSVGMLLLVFTPVDGHYLTNVLPSMLLFAIGGGTAIPAIMSTAMSETTPADAGASSGLLSTSQQVGSAVGLAVLAALATAETSRAAGRGVGPTRALVDGYHLGWGVGAGLLAASVVIAATTIGRSGADHLAFRPWRRPTSPSTSSGTTDRPSPSRRTSTSSGPTR